jgi:hypothetical protein
MTAAFQGPGAGRRPEAKWSSCKRTAAPWSISAGPGISHALGLRPTHTGRPQLPRTNQAAVPDA